MTPSGTRRAAGAPAAAVLPSLLDYKLPRGRHGLSRELVAESQRWRLIGAALEVFAERGYVDMTSHDVAAAAGVSRSTFYTHFDDLPDVLLAALEAALAAVEEAVLGGCRGEPEGADRIAAALAPLDSLLDAEPPLARLLDLEIAAISSATAARRELLFARLATAHAAAEPGRGRGREGSALARRARLAAAASLLAEPRPGADREDLRRQLGRLLCG